MSGNFGWRGESRDRDDAAPSAFSDAHSAYSPGTSYTRSMPSADPGTVGPAPFSRRVDPDPVPPSPAYPPVDLTVRPHTISALNYLGVAIDTTGSVGPWRPELFKRLAFLFLKSLDFLGGKSGHKHDPTVDNDPPDSAPVTMIDGRKILELQFVGFGDASVNGRYGRSDTIEVAPPGSGPELEGYLHHMRKDCDGGGNDCESSDMALLYADRMLNFPHSIRQKLFVIVTDEPYPEVIDPEHAMRWLGITLQAPTPLRKVVDSLRTRGWSVWCVQKPYGSYPSDPTTQATRDKWKKLLGNERVVDLDDARRVVDVIIGIVALAAGKFDAFTADLRSRHLTPGNPYGRVNVDTVLTSLAPASTVLGAARPLRAPQSRRLLPAGGDSGPMVIDAEIVEDA